MSVLSTMTLSATVTCALHKIRVKLSPVAYSNVRIEKNMATVTMCVCGDDVASCEEDDN